METHEPDIRLATCPDYDRVDEEQAIHAVYIRYKEVRKDSNEQCDELEAKRIANGRSEREINICAEPQT